MKTKTFTILITSNETVIIPEIVVLKPRILYDLDQQPSKIRLIKERVNSSSTFVREINENFKKALCRAVQDDSTKTKVLAFVRFVSFGNAFLMAIKLHLVVFHETHLKDI